VAVTAETQLVGHGSGTVAFLLPREICDRAACVLPAQDCIPA
jgi:hypothetical protein